MKTRCSWCVMEGGRCGRRMQLPKDRLVYRGLGDLGLPKEFLVEDRFGVQGGVELGMLSTTQDQRVATQYAGTKMPTVFKIGVGAVDRGAPIKFLSQYPAEEEILLPPMSYLEVTGETRMEAGAGGKTTRVVSLSVNANQTCGTIAPHPPHLPQHGLRPLPSANTLWGGMRKQRVDARLELVLALRPEALSRGSQL